MKKAEQSRVSLVEVKVGSHKLQIDLLGMMLFWAEIHERRRASGFLVCLNKRNVRHCRCERRQSKLWVLSYDRYRSYVRPCKLLRLPLMKLLSNQISSKHTFSAAFEWDNPDLHSGWSCCCTNNVLMQRRVCTSLRPKSHAITELEAKFS